MNSLFPLKTLVINILCWVRDVLAILLISLVSLYVIHKCAEMTESSILAGTSELPRLRLSYFIGDHGWGYQSIVRTSNLKHSVFFSPLHLLLSAALSERLPVRENFGKIKTGF